MATLYDLLADVNKKLCSDVLEPPDVTAQLDAASNRPGDQFYQMLISINSSLGYEATPIISEASLYNISKGLIDHWKDVTQIQNPFQVAMYERMQRNNPEHLWRTGALDVLAPDDTKPIDSPHHLLTKLASLKSKPPSKKVSLIQHKRIDTLTVGQRRANQLILNHSVSLPSGEIVQRPPCMNGPPGRDGHIGCAVYKIKGYVAGQLGVYLSLREVHAFKTTGELPPACETRKCLLCYTLIYTKRAGLFNADGKGLCQDVKDPTSVLWQDIVGTVNGDMLSMANGFNTMFIIKPGDHGHFPPVPFCAFNLDGYKFGEHTNEQGVRVSFVDESDMWFKPEAPVKPQNF